MFASANSRMPLPALRELESKVGRISPGLRSIRNSGPCTANPSTNRLLMRSRPCLLLLFRRLALIRLGDGPALGGVLTKVAETIATEDAKNSSGDDASVVDLNPGDAMLQNELPPGRKYLWRVRH